MWLLGAVPSLLLATLLVAGTGAWWLTGRRMRRAGPSSRHGLEAQAALWRHPAGRGRWPEPGALVAPELPGGPMTGRAQGPDDDPDFIRALEQLIRGEDHGGG